MRYRVSQSSFAEKHDKTDQGMDSTSHAQSMIRKIESKKSTQGASGFFNGLLADVIQ
jgi:hypothetical protein